MTLLAMVTAIFYAAFHLGIRAVEKGQKAVVTAQRLRAANDVHPSARSSRSSPYPASEEDGER